MYYNLRQCVIIFFPINIDPSNGLLTRILRKKNYTDQSDFNHCIQWKNIIIIIFG